MQQISILVSSFHWNVPGEQPWNGTLPFKLMCIIFLSVCLPKQRVHFYKKIIICCAFSQGCFPESFKESYTTGNVWRTRWPPGAYNLPTFTFSVISWCQSNRLFLLCRGWIYLKSKFWRIFLSDKIECYWLLLTLVNYSVTHLHSLQRPYYSSTGSLSNIKYKLLLITYKAPCNLTRAKHWTLGDWAVAFAAPTLWNSLPQYTRNSDSLQAF